MAQKFDAPLQKGPGWVHVIWKIVTQNSDPNQVYPPPYYQDEQWYEIDEDGWVLRNVTTHRNTQENIIQQAATIGSTAYNFTFGESFNDIASYRISLDMLTQDLAQATRDGSLVLSEETTCDDGSACLLITVSGSLPLPAQNPGETQPFIGAGRRVWINLQNGQQVKYQSF